jgi:hypothetical protein
MYATTLCMYVCMYDIRYDVPKVHTASNECTMVIVETRVLQ